MDLRAALSCTRLAGTPCRATQKNPRVRKIRVRNSGAGNGCAVFMGSWKNAFFSAGKPVSIRFFVLGGAILGLGGGGKCRFYFYGHGDFSELHLSRYTCRS